MIKRALPIFIATLILATSLFAGEADSIPGAPDPWAGSPLEAQSATPCTGGLAGAFPCSKIDLLSFLPVASLGCTATNVVWGWTDPLTGKEYALVGCNNGVSFVDISAPESPVYLGRLPGHAANSSWRDVKVYANHAYVGSEAVGHGIQVFNLTQLRGVTIPQTFAETTWYGGLGRSHTVAVNEATGFIYAAGSRDSCSAGLHMINVQTPASPVFAGCVGQDGYTHETQCVTYQGPDVAYQGREICFNSNEDTLTLVDVTVKNSPVQLSRTGYPGSRYTHQTWLTEDHRYLLLDDELDEQNFGHNSRTYIWDVENLDRPVLMGNYTGPTAAIDHNIYIKGTYAYESNYTAGLRVLDLKNIADASLTEAGFFDIFPGTDAATFNGSWCNYPFFASGVIAVVGIEQGLFLLRTAFPPDFLFALGEPTSSVCAGASDTTAVAITARNGHSAPITLSVTGLPTGATAAFSTNPFTGSGSTQLTITATGTTAPGTYPLQVTGSDGTISFSRPLSLLVTDGLPGIPTLIGPPDGATGQPPRPAFTWTNGAGTVSSEIQIATDAGFTNVVHSAAGLTTGSYTPDTDLVLNTRYFWRIRATNGCGTVPSEAFQLTIRTPFGQCPAGTSPLTIYSENFETGATGWTHSGTGDSWTLSGARVHGGSFSYKATDPATPSDQRLESPAISLPSGQSPVTLQFWNYQHLEDRTGGCYDGGIVEISTNGGTSWTQLVTQLQSDPYDGPIAGGFSNPLAGLNAWCGDPQNWLNSIVTLDAFAPANSSGPDINAIKLRFRLGSDNTGGREGWYIDDVLIQSCLPAGTPSASVTDVSAPESHALGPQAPSHPIHADFVVTLSGVSSSVVSIAYATADGSATQPADYTAAAGTVTFQPGETQKSISVFLENDTIDEPDETFTLTLSSPLNAIIADGIGIGTILDDDTFAVSDVDPDSGPSSGGTTIIITGSSFLPGASVRLGTLDATNENVTSGTITATTPSMAPATFYDVIVANPGGAEAMFSRKFFSDFLDVAQGQQFHDHIVTIAWHGITLGCNATSYCPEGTVQRQAMAAFIARAMAGSDANVPPSGTVGASAYNCAGGGVSLFSDVPPTSPFCRHIHYIAAQGVTLGCTAGTYCPTADVARGQMAMFVSRAISGGDSGVPSARTDAVTGRSYDCSPSTPSLHFTDVLTSDVYCRHTHYLWSRGMIDGCTGTTYCPAPNVTRRQMAKFLVNGFELVRP